MAEARAMIDIIAAKARPHQLLEQIGFLIRALGRAETGQRLGTARVANPRQAPGCDIERLVPRGFAKHF